MTDFGQGAVPSGSSYPSSVGPTPDTGSSPVQSAGLDPTALAGVAEASRAEAAAESFRGAEGSIVLANSALLTQTDSGPIEIPGLTLVFDKSGLAIKKVSGELVSNIDWGTISEIEIKDEPKHSPIDPPAISIGVHTIKRTHQFKKNNLEAEAVSKEIGQLAKTAVGAKGLVNPNQLSSRDIIPWAILIGSIVLAVLLFLLHISGKLTIY
jgi:hypothetical protein